MPTTISSATGRKIRSTAASLGRSMLRQVTESTRQHYAPRNRGPVVDSLAARPEWQPATRAGTTDEAFPPGHVPPSPGEPPAQAGAASRRARLRRYQLPLKTLRRFCNEAARTLQLLENGLAARLRAPLRLGAQHDPPVVDPRVVRRRGESRQA